MVRKGSILRYLSVLLVSSCLARAGLHDSGVIKNVLENSSEESTKNKYMDARNSSPRVSDELKNDMISSIIHTNDSHYREDIKLQTRSQRIGDEANVLSVFSPKDTNFQKHFGPDSLREPGEKQDNFLMLQSSPSDKVTEGRYRGNKTSFSLNTRRRIRSLRDNLEISGKLSQHDNKHSNSPNLSSTSESQSDVVSLTIRNSLYEHRARNNDISVNQETSFMSGIRGEEKFNSNLFEDYENDSPSVSASLNSQSSVSEGQKSNLSPILSSIMNNKSNSKPTSHHWKFNTHPPYPRVPEDEGRDSRSREENLESLGRTTSHREALVRAALITEDRDYDLKILPRNKIVGLTLEPHTRHRLLFPVERSGFLSISLAPCGLPVQWSLALRSLPPRSATEETLTREGQDTTQSAEDHEAQDTESMEASLSEPGGSRRGVVMLGARQGDGENQHTRPWREHTEQNNTGAVGSTITKTKKVVRLVETSLSENDVLFHETDRKTTFPENTTKSTQMDVPDIIVNQTNIRKTSSKSKPLEHLGTTSGDGNRRLGRVSFPEDKYKQSESLRSVLSDEFRKTNSNVYSLKNLAYDIGRSDFFENEFNKIRYHREYEEVLRSSRERRDTSRVRQDRTNEPTATPIVRTKHESVYHQASTTRCDANNDLCSNYPRGVRYLSSGTVPEEVWFEDPIHSNWLDGNYRDDSQLDSAHSHITEDAIYSMSNINFGDQGGSQNVIFIPSRHRSRLRKFRNRFKSFKNKSMIPHRNDRNYTNRPNDDGEDNPHRSTMPKLDHDTDVRINFTRLRTKIPSPTPANDGRARDIRSYETNAHQKINLNSKIYVYPNESRNFKKLIMENTHQRLPRSVAGGTDNSALRPSAYIFLNYLPSLIPSESHPREQSNIIEMRLSETTTVPVPTENTTTAGPPTREQSNLREMRLSETTTVPIPTDNTTTTGPPTREQSNLREMRLSETTTVPVPTDNTTTTGPPTRGQINLQEMRLSETSTVPVPGESNPTTSNPLVGMSIRDIINSIWKRPKLKTSKVLQVKESNNSNRFEAQDIASTTIWGRSSSYDELDSGHGDQVWIFQRRNATPGIYVITVSSGSSAVSLQAVASRRPFASYYQPLPVTSIVSRRPDEPPILTVSWLTSKESSQTARTKRIQRHREREQKSLQGDLNHRLARLQRARKNRLTRNPTTGGHTPPERARNHTNSGRHTKRGAMQGAASNRGSTTSHRGDFMRATYCLALSEVRPHESLCGARASSEANLKLGCTRQPHYSLPLTPQVYRDVHPKKRYYVTVWRPGSLMPLGQTILRGSGRGRVPRLRQGVMHRILLSAGGAATARFRVRRSQPRLHVAAVSCYGGLAVTVRQGGPRGPRVVRARSRSALILAVHNPPKGLLHLTVTPSIPHTAHTFLIAAATSARRLPFPRLPPSLSVQADVISCSSGSLSWQSAPGRPKYCVLLQEVEGRPKITWPPRQCGWDRMLSDPASLSHCSVGYRGRRQAWELLRLKENTTYTVTVLVTHRLTNRSLSLSPTMLTTPACL